MESFLASIKIALENKNYIAALALSLVVPDICGNVEFPNTESEEHYKKWFDNFVRQYYKTNTSESAGYKVEGKDCFAWRNVFFNEGKGEYTRAKAKEIVSHLNPLIPGNASALGAANINPLVLGKDLVGASNVASQGILVDEFCHNILAGAEKWLEGIKGQTDKVDRVTELSQQFDKILDVEYQGRLKKPVDAESSDELIAITMVVLVLIGVITFLS